MPAWKTASENAKANGVPYGIVMTTTPSSLDDPAGKFCKSMIDGAARFVLACFDMTDEELEAFVTSNSTNDFLYVEYSYKELGRDEAWLEKMKRELNNDMGKVKREILLEWPHSMESAVFSEETLDMIYHYVKKEPVTTINVDNRYPVLFYEQPDLTKNYILSCDVSGGLSNDNSVITFIDPGTFKPIGTFKSKKIDTDSFKKLIYTLMTLYFTNSLLVVESNSYGLNLLDSFMKDPLIEPRMYREPRIKQGEKTLRDGVVVKKSTRNVMYGVATTPKSRQAMIDLLFSIVNDEPDTLINPNIYHDLVTLERKKTGKIEHADGEHDDDLMSYLIFRYAVFYGTCFRDRFHIAPVAAESNIKRKSLREGERSRLERILNSGNFDNAQAALSSNPLYDQLLDQQRKMNEQFGENEKQKKINSFMRICNLNKN